MPQALREQPNQRRQHQPSASNQESVPAAPFSTATRPPTSIEDDLRSALALAFSIELMGFGLGTFGDEYSKAFITVAQSLSEHLSAATAAYTAIRKADREACLKESTPTRSAVGA